MHGAPAGLTDLPERLYPDDPDIAYVHADMNAWAEAHPCPCEAVCECDDA
jgi:hypothetical protein